MTQPVSRKWWLALSIAAALASAPAFAAKDVVVAVGSNFTTLDPYDANDTLSQAVAKSFYQGLFGLDKEMKLQNVLAESYTVSPDGLVYTIKSDRAELIVQRAGTLAQTILWANAPADFR